MLNYLIIKVYAFEHTIFMVAQKLILHLLTFKITPEKAGNYRKNN